MIKNFNTFSVVLFLMVGMLSFSTTAYGRRPVGNVETSRTDSHRSGSLNGKRSAVKNDNRQYGTERKSRPGYAGTASSQGRRPVANHNVDNSYSNNRHRTDNYSRPGVSTSAPARRAETTQSSHRNNNNSSVNAGSNRGNSTYVGNSHRGGQGSGSSSSNSERNRNYGYNNGYYNNGYNNGYYGSQSQSQGGYYGGQSQYQGYGNQYQYQYGCNNNYNYHRYQRPYRNHGYYCPPPTRPYRRSYVRYTRPVYPANYRPLSTAPIIRGILGLTFGVTSYISSLDYLFNNNYYIDGYDNGYIYLRNVHNMGYYWDDVILNYSNMGYLYSTQFVKSYSYADNYMFNNLYNNLYYQYGQPVSYVSNMYGTTSTWYGRDGRTYLTLSYSSQYVNGYIRYYTMLTYTSC